MDTAGLLVDAFGRIRQAVHQAVEGLSPEGLAFRPDGQANSIAWLVWHLTRIQDDHLADAEGREQTWTAGGWVGRFSLPLDPSDTGYGHTSDHVAAVRVDSGRLLTGYYDDVHRETVRFLERVAQSDLDRIVDRSWDPPVTLGVRLNSVLADDLQHAGQAAYVRGLLLRR
jgi:Protein of unknown function (DUF664)